jgi:hypothetical protein
VDTDEIRAIALGLPEAQEQPHFDVSSFRVRGKIFATLPEAGFVHVMCGEAGIREAVAEYPVLCSQRWWGKRLAAVRVDLAGAPRELLVELLTEAWRRKAPRTLVRAFDS